VLQQVIVGRGVTLKVLLSAREVDKEQTAKPGLAGDTKSRE
jgi:hypothetical protein